MAPYSSGANETVNDGACLLQYMYMYCNNDMSDCISIISNLCHVKFWDTILLPECTQKNSHRKKKP
jgi:hypothetical protein